MYTDYAVRGLRGAGVMCHASHMHIRNARYYDTVTSPIMVIPHNATRRDTAQDDGCNSKRPTRVSMAHIYIYMMPSIVYVCVYIYIYIYIDIVPYIAYDIGPGRAGVGRGEEPEDRGDPSITRCNIIQYTLTQ